ncbi:MAG TPA: hypothetical protein VFR41_08460 [Acidimicrobiia bacterium]|nr:hypothetical protein [Acidimicrobiia bacterium]
MQRRGLAIVGSTALVVRVAYAALFMRGYRPVSDAGSYDAIAREVTHGHGFVSSLPFEYLHPTAIRPPLFPALAAAAYRMFGVHVGVGQAVNILAGSAAAVLAVLLGARLAGSRAGLFAGLVVALSPPLIANDVTLLAESVAVLTCFACLLFLLGGRTALAGAALGLMMLDRASAQWLVLVLGAWVVWRFGWRHALRFVAVSIVVVAPWVARNWIHVGGPVVVATNGFNVNAYYSPEAQHQNGFVNAYFDGRFAAIRADAIDEVDLDSTLQRRGLTNLRHHPTLLGHVVNGNLQRWFELRPGENRDPEKIDGRNLGVRNVTLPLFYVMTALGIFVLYRARRSAAAQLLAIVAAYFTVVCALSIAVPRLRSVFDACIAVAVGVGIAWWRERLVAARVEPPEPRAFDARRNVLTMLSLAVAIFALAAVLHHTTRSDARAAVTRAATRDDTAFDSVAQQLVAAQAGRVPSIDPASTDRLHDALGVLGNRAPELRGALDGRLRTALTSLRRATHDVDVVQLLSAGELFGHHADGPQLSRVRDRYETARSKTDQLLDPWDDVVGGAALRRARDALDGLRIAVS